MGRRILLIEPNYRNKYPPIGLMKLATYHKLQGDRVEFFKGDLKKISIRLKVEACIKGLNKIDKRINWQTRESIIKNYIITRQIKYIGELAESSNPNQLTAITEVLKTTTRKTPLDKWDRIYITTLFTFYWDITIKTIEFAKTLVSDKSRVYVGGVMASLLQAEILEATGIAPFDGLLDKPGILDPTNKMVIDELPLDYSILHETEYEYPTQSAYFTYMTKGCTRKCAFCSVPKLEPTYKDKIPTKDKFDLVNTRFGEQRNLLLMDNNVLASPKFPEIIQEIKDMGFHAGATYTEPNQLDIAIKNIRSNFNEKVYVKIAHDLLLGLQKRMKGEVLTAYQKILTKYHLDKTDMPTRSGILNSYRYLKVTFEKYRYKSILTRYVDFNQGTDARYVTEENMKLMSEIPIHPLRIAFDHVSIKETYIKAVELAAKYGIKNLSNYILYNFHDKPEDFYERLKINVDIGKRLNIQIFSFPMKYIPLFGEEAKHRRYIGKNWNRKFIRAIQSILNATKGIVAPGYDFFNMAFGESLEEFMEILWMPEAYIINRRFFEGNGMTQQWRDDFNSLTELEKIEARQIIEESVFLDLHKLTQNANILRLLSHYEFTKEGRSVIRQQVKRQRDKYNKLIKKDVFINLTLTHDFDSQIRNKIA